MIFITWMQISHFQDKSNIEWEAGGTGRQSPKPICHALVQLDSVERCNLPLDLTRRRWKEINWRYISWVVNRGGRQCASERRCLGGREHTEVMANGRKTLSTTVQCHPHHVLHLKHNPSWSAHRILLFHLPQRILASPGTQRWLRSPAASLRRHTGWRARGHGAVNSTVMTAAFVIMYARTPMCLPWSRCMRRTTKDASTGVGTCQPWARDYGEISGSRTQRRKVCVHALGKEVYGFACSRR